jgi:hypothetical protein
MLKISEYKHFIFLLTAVFIASCAAQKEKPVVSMPVEKKMEVEKKTGPPEIKKDQKSGKTYAIRCEENTDTISI